MTVAVPAATEAAAVSVTCCRPPGVRLNVAGAAVTPAGRPLTAMLTLDVKTSTSPTLTVTVWLWPLFKVRLGGEAEIEKSPAGGGAVPPPPPHPPKSTE
ncbi:MAG: hypothetical protein ABSG60_00725 [Terracidiphilus sp.]